MKTLIFCYLSIILVILALHASPSTSIEQTSKFLNNLTDPENYDKRLRPNYGGKPYRPVDVEINMDVSSIEIGNTDFTLDFFLRQRWTDDRLKFTDTDINYSDIVIADEGFQNDIWVPDVYFPNEKSRAAAPPHSSLVRIQHSGLVLLSKKCLGMPIVVAYSPLDGQLYRITPQEWKAQQLQAQLPKISYLKTTDVYLGVCFLLTFAALIHYAVVCYMWKKFQGEYRTVESMAVDSGLHPVKNRAKTRGFAAKICIGFGPATLDKFARIIFPMIFGAFNLAYWYE